MPLGSVPHCHQQVLSSWIQLWAGSSKTRRVTISTFTGLGQSEDVPTQEERPGGPPPHTPLPPPPPSVPWQAGCGTAGAGGARGDAMRHLLWDHILTASGPYNSVIPSVNNM